MASALLRSVARTAKTTSASRLAARKFSSSFVRKEETPTQKTAFDYHTVEDLHGMTAHEILSGPADDAKMRHFTGMSVLSWC